MIRGARVWTDGALRTDVDAVAVAGGRIVAIGREADLRPILGPATRVLDAAGATLTPGLTDAHIHLVQWARSLSEASLHDATSAADASRRVAAFAAEHTGDGPQGSQGPIVGRGWDANGWSEPPHRALLDRAFPSRPVLLHSRDFHALWVNGAALAACGITRATPDPAGGRVVRDTAGEPTGVLMENAVRLCAALISDDSTAEASAVEGALLELHALGVTGVHDFEGPAAQRLLHEFVGRGAPRLRVLMHLAHSALDSAIGLGVRSGIGDDTFRLGAVKLFADGTLGSRTAAMLAPYERTSETGIDILSPADLRATVARCVAAGLSVAIHAIGDRAVRSALDAFEHARPSLPRLALPPRIEHLQLVDAADLPRFARLGVAASMQPSHAISDAALAELHWGARIDASYPWRGVLDSGALLAFGSDAPVEPPDAPFGLAAAVGRMARTTGMPFTPHQRVTLDEALSAYTEGPAKLAGQWPRLGTLRLGAEADLVVWNTDLHTLALSRLAEARPAATLVQGRIVWSAPAQASAAIERGAQVMA